MRCENFLFLLRCDVAADGRQLVFTVISAEDSFFNVNHYYTLIASNGREMDRRTIEAVDDLFCDVDLFSQNIPAMLLRDSSGYFLLMGWK